MKLPKVTINCWLILLCLAGLLGVSSVALGQFAVVSTVPADGAANVDTAATIEITFSAPLDTSARFPWPPSFYLGLIISPDTLIGEPDSIVLSPDLKTVRVFNLHLWPDTRYVFGILGARSSTGAALEKPTIFTFTTGSALPSATVSGTITFPGGDPAGTMVALFREPFGDNPAAMAVVPSAAGTYTMNYVTGGVYWPVALKDLDNSGKFEPEPGVDVVAIYDPIGNGLAHALVVPEGRTTSGIDMTLLPITAMTARQRYSEVLSAAQIWSSDADPVLVGASGISASGESSFWICLFYSQNRSEYLGVLASSAFIAPFPWQDEPPDTTALPENWINSDVAADSAEAHGGSDFRATHSDVFVTAFLGNFDFEEQALSAHTLAIPQRGPIRQSHRLADDLGFSFQKATRLRSTHPIWFFQYASAATGDFLMVVLDAVSGEFIYSYPPKPTTARFNLEAANQAAAAWAADAKLLMIITRELPVPSGETTVWAFIYHSAVKDSSRVFLMAGGIVAGEEPFLHTIPSFEPLPTNWVDSPIAVATAEAAGGSQYRNTHENVYVDVHLSRGLYAPDATRAVWWFEYFSSAPKLELFVDALTGKIITGVDSKPGIGIPQNYILSQNHPNPFLSGAKSRSAGNPETVIEYQLPRASEVEISIFNLQGQKVATLVRGHQTSGAHKIVWKGTDESGRMVASGVYLYLLKAGDFVLVKKMLILH